LCLCVCVCVCVCVCIQVEPRSIYPNRTPASPFVSKDVKRSTITRQPTSRGQALLQCTRRSCHTRQLSNRVNLLVSNYCRGKGKVPYCTSCAHFSSKRLEEKWHNWYSTAPFLYKTATIRGSTPGRPQVVRTKDHSVSCPLSV